MRKLWLWGLLPAVACSVPPAGYVDLRHDLDQRITYRYSAGWDLRYVPSGTQAPGNCSTFAYTAWRELQDQHALLFVCHLRGGEAHAFTVAQGWLFDIRQPLVRYSPAAVGCVDFPLRAFRQMQ